MTSETTNIETPANTVLSDKAEVRYRVMRAIAQNPNASQRDLARMLGLSLGGVNFCLKALIDKGAVKVENFRAADNKLRYAYILTSQGIGEKAQLTGRFLQRKMHEYEALKSEIASLQDELGTNPADEVR